MDQLPAVFDIVAKGGVTGILLVICFVLGSEVVRLRKQNTKIFTLCEGYRLRYALYKNACTQAKISVDESAFAPIGSLE
jgi:hypothetical protein